jgi:hypothetical protein
MNVEETLFKVHDFRKKVKYKIKCPIRMRLLCKLRQVLHRPGAQVMIYPKTCEMRVVLVLIHIHLFHSTTCSTAAYGVWELIPVCPLSS